MESIAYTLVRSERKTLSIQITKDAKVVVRAPRRMDKREIDRIIVQRAEWISAHLAKANERAETRPAEPTAEELGALAQRAMDILPGRVRHFSQLMGLVPAGITITYAATRFGSCSGKNRLCFSCRLMRYPMEAIDYVVVHELAHIAHKNHGPDFYATIARIMPDHKERRALLKG